MKQVVALRELFESITVQKVCKANQTPYNTIVCHYVPVSHDFDLVELRLTEAFRDQEESVLI